MSIKLYTEPDSAITGVDVLAKVTEKVLATSADAVATAADRVQTGLDRAQTGADRVQTGADRVQTGADRVQTGADRVQTGLDRTATAADVVLTAANKTASETARDAAFANANVYADIATGRAAVADGAQFMVVGTNEIIRYRRDSSSTQTEMARYPTAAGAYSTDLLRINEKRTETARAAGIYNALNRQVAASIVLRSATRNADGTITIPASDYIMSQAWNTTDAMNPLLWWYLHVGVSDLSGSVVTLDAKFNSTDYATGGGILAGTTETTTTLGCKKLALRNNNGSGTAFSNVRWFVHNPNATPITIYPPFYTTDDIAHPPEFITGVDDASAEPLPVRDRDWTKLFTSSRPANFRASKAVTKASDSVNGLSGNAGTLYAPKQTLAQMGAFATGDVIGLYRGSLWRDETIQLYPNTLPGIEVIDVCFGALGRLPKLSAFKAVPDGSWTNNGNGTYSYSYTSDDTLIDTNNPATLYDEVYPIRIDTTLAVADYPITREERPIKKYTGADCIATADSYYVTGSGTSWTMMIHPIDGAAPGTRYTFEVITKYYNVTFNPFTYNASLRGVWVSGAGMGYGPIAGSSDFYGERFIITHGNTHGIVWQGGLLENFMVYGRGGPNLAALVAYTTNATGRRAGARNFYLLGIAGSGLYSHNSGGDGQAWESVRYENGVIIGTGRQANGGLLPSAAIAGNNVKALSFRDMFVEGFGVGLSASVGIPVVICENMIFNKISTNVSSNLYQNNIARFENYGDPVNVNNRSVTMMTSGVGKVAKKNLHYAKYIDQGVGATDQVCKSLAFTGNTITFRQNIVIFGADWTNIYWISGLSSGYSGMDIDYNLYVHVSGSPFVSGSQFSAPFGREWDAYLATNGGIDQNSKYIDLRSDIRGVKAAFVDPDNLNFQIAETAVGRVIRDYIAAHDVGPDYVISRRPNVPTADEVARMIEHL